MNLLTRRKKTLCILTALMLREALRFRLLRAGVKFTKVNIDATYDTARGEYSYTYTYTYPSGSPVTPIGPFTPRRGRRTRPNYERH